MAYRIQERNKEETDEERNKDWQKQVKKEHRGSGAENHGKEKS